MQAGDRPRWYWQMSVSDPVTDSIPRWRSILAALLSVGVLLSTFLWLVIWAVVTLQLIGGVYEGGELLFVGIVFTAPVVFIFTCLSLLLVGAKRCKVACISAFLYLVCPLLILLISGVVSELFR